MERFLGIAAGLIKTYGQVPKGLIHVVDHVTFGSFTREERTGNKEPRYFFDEIQLMSMNAVGLANQGLDAFLKDDLPRLLDFGEAGATIRISLAPLGRGDVSQMVTKLNQNSLVAKMRCEVEINAACPNHWSKDGKLHDVVAKDPDALESLMQEGAHFNGKKSIKIAPDMEYVELERCIDLAIAYDYYAIVSGNTRRAETPVDENGKKKLSQDFGGVGGKPLFAAMIEQLVTLRNIIHALETKRGPEIIACGGIMNAGNASEVLKTGVSRMQVATYYAVYGAHGVVDLVSELM